MKTVSAYVRYGSISWILLILSESVYNWNWKQYRNRNQNWFDGMQWTSSSSLLLSVFVYFIGFRSQSSIEGILLASKSFSWTVIQLQIDGYELAKEKIKKSYLVESNYFKYDDIKTYSLCERPKIIQTWAHTTQTHTTQITIELGTWFVQQMLHNSNNKAYDVRCITFWFTNIYIA